VEAVMQEQPKQLLEVGPGGAAITKYFVTKNLDFKVVEIDSEKVKFLAAKYPSLQSKIVHGSILEVEPPFATPFYVVGNFPYNISTEILFKMMEWRSKVQGVVGMFQKEVAQRVSAGPGSKTYGVVSVLLQCFFRIEYLFDVQEQDFNPPPNVKSGVIKMYPLDKEPNFTTYKKMDLLVKTAFSQRRKTLRNAVKSLFSPAILADSIFEKRAEQLSVADFAALTHKMN
jgi:16S rRNA (adenine1518-N6/adenine1519-N6)-dimethyltransferase